MEQEEHERQDEVISNFLNDVSFGFGERNNCNEPLLTHRLK